MAASERESLLHTQPDAAKGISETNEESEHRRRQRESFPTKRDIANDVIPETAVTGRKLGWASAYILVLSRVIGSGIFAMPGTILQSVGSPALALFVWIVGAVIAWCALSIDIEYGCMLPRSGGMKVYLEYTYQRPRFLASMIVAVHAVLLGFTASNCIVFAKYVLFATRSEVTDLHVKILAVALMTVITLVHGCAYRTGVWIQNLLGWLKIGLISFMIVTGMYVVIIGRGTVSSETISNGSLNEASSLSNGFWDGSDWSYGTISTALFKVYYSYAGLDNLNNVVNEVKNPVKTLKRAPMMALFTACVLYVFVNLAYLAVVPITVIKETRELIAAVFFERVFGQGFGSTFLPIAIALSAAGNVMVVTFSVSRVNQEVARQGFLPFAKFLASSRPFNSPLGGLLVHYFPSVLVIILPPSSDVYALIADIEGYTGQWFALAVAVGLLILRHRKADLLRPFKAWTPAVYIRITICILLIVAPLFPPSVRPGSGGKTHAFFYASYAVIALSVLASSVIYWAFWTRWLPRYHDSVVEEEKDILDDGTSITRLVWYPKNLTLQ